MRVEAEALERFTVMAATRGWTVTRETFGPRIRPEWELINVFSSWTEDPDDVDQTSFDFDSLPPEHEWERVFNGLDQIKADQIEDRRLEPLRQAARDLQNGGLAYDGLNTLRRFGREEVMRALAENDERNRLDTPRVLRDLDRIFA